MTLIDYFLTTTTKLDIYPHFINILIIISNIMIQYRIVIFFAAIHNTIFYFVSHIPSCERVPLGCGIRAEMG